MNKFKEFIFKPKNLFYATCIFLTLAIISGLFINIYVDSNVRIRLAVIFGIILLIQIFYLLYGFTVNAVKVLKSYQNERGNLFKLYFKDGIFRTTINNAITSTLSLAYGLTNYVTSFSQHRWYYLSTAAVFFAIFIMKLYLVVSVSKNQKRQNMVIASLLTLMAFACSGITVLIAVNDTGFRAKGLIIYWDALYAFIAIYNAISGVIKALKKHDHVKGRFLSVAFANAFFAMFSLTVSMLLTFTEGSQDLTPWYILAGAVTTLLIFFVAFTQVLLFNKQKSAQQYHVNE